MNAADLVAALDLPPGARVDRRVPKTLLVEHGAPTAADKRRINEGIEEVQWVATLKPTTIGVPSFRDAVREYLEIAVLSVVMRTGAKAGRLAELIHRAIPYPLFLIVTEGDRLTLSLAHKRWSHVETGARVLDDDPVAVTVSGATSDGPQAAFLHALSLAGQPRADLFALYQGWIDTLIALLASLETGTFNVVLSPALAAARRAALAECALLSAQLAKLRVAADKERQVARRVELTLKIKHTQADYAAAKAKL